MSNKIQSSVDWLISCITEDQMVKSKSLNEWLEIFDQAKARHKQEIIGASAQGYLMGVDEGFPLETAHNYAHQWYNNQFGEDNDE
jgi:hypothetical protein